MEDGKLRRLTIIGLFLAVAGSSLSGCSSQKFVDPGVDAFGFGNDKDAALRVKDSVDRNKLKSEEELAAEHVDYLGIDREAGRR